MSAILVIHLFVPSLMLTFNRLQEVNAMNVIEVIEIETEEVIVEDHALQATGFQGHLVAT
jgi:hypothetical protein